MGSSILTACLFLGMYIPYSVLACKCALPHPQKRFCDSKFVIRGRVTNVTEMTEEYKKVYTVDVIDTYKGENIDSQMLIYTSKSTASCGVYLEVNKEYVIGGSRKGDRWKIYSCGGIRENWDTGNVCVKQNIINGKYKKNCSCKLENCNGISTRDGVCRKMWVWHNICVWTSCRY